MISRAMPIQPLHNEALFSKVRRQHKGMTIIRPLIFVFLTFVICFAHSRQANADFKLCNTTGSRVGVSIGYKDPKGWATEGWWNLPSNTCETLLKGNLISRYYYIHAVDYDRGGEWAGKSFMCTDSKSFTIRDVTDCAKRGYERNGFFEVDTGEERDWTVRLTEPAESGNKKQ